MPASPLRALFSGDEEERAPLSPPSTRSGRLAALSTGVARRSSSVSPLRLAVASPVRSAVAAAVVPSPTTPSPARSTQTTGVAAADGSRSRAAWRHNFAGRGVLLHSSTLRLVWDVLLSLAVLWTAWRLPLQLGVGWDGGAALDALDSVMEVLFVSDVLLNFNTSYLQQGEVVTERRRIAAHYCRGWFFIDLLSSLPWELIGAGSTVRSLRYLRLPKLLRLARVVKYARAYLQYALLLQLCLSLPVILHLLACAWLATVSELDVLPLWQRYATAVYAAACLLCGLPLSVEAAHAGAGNADVLLQLFSVAAVLLGLAITAVLVGNSYVALSTGTSLHAEFERQVSRIMREMEDAQLPVELQDRVRSYYDYLWRHEKAAGLTGLAHDEHLSYTLRREVALFLHADILQQVPLFDSVSAECMADVVMCLSYQLILENELVVRKGDIGREMYIILRGQVQVWLELPGELQPVNTLGPGQFFGEIALLTEAGRTASVRSVQVCELSVLRKADFVRLLAQYPELLSRTLEVAEARELDLERIRGKVARKRHSVVRQHRVLPKLGSKGDILMRFRRMSMSGSFHSVATSASTSTPSVDASVLRDAVRVEALESQVEALRSEVATTFATLTETMQALASKCGVPPPPMD